MRSEDLLQLFAQFGLAALLGFLIGLEREMRERENRLLGIRDFVLFALLGAIASYLAVLYQLAWLIVAGLLGVLALLYANYRSQVDAEPGITTELAALFTYLLGAVVMHGGRVLAIALAILALGVLFPKDAIHRFRASVQTHELRAALLFLVITFVILPVLPRESLDNYLTMQIGSVAAFDDADQRVRIDVLAGKSLQAGERVFVYDATKERLGRVDIERVERGQASGIFHGERPDLVHPGGKVRSSLGIGFLDVMLSAVRPYRMWLIVVLVSFISFAGYVLIKLLGGRAGIGLTGLIGGVVSSTVTTLSFARHSREAPAGNRLYAVAVILASSIMFPRLILEIAVVNPELMRNIVLPLGVMGGTGFALAGILYWRTRGLSVDTPSLQLNNPFNLTSALGFALVFASMLMLTRLAATYMGDSWLPLVAVVSGLTDADAIAFSISNLHQAGLLHQDWAAFNLVLGALSNTFMKLLLVLLLGHRELARQLLFAFVTVGAVGLLVTVLYYDLGTLLAAGT